MIDDLHELVFYERAREIAIRAERYEEHDQPAFATFK